MESLSHMLNLAGENGKLQGLKVSSSSLALSHLFFADDIIFFAKPTLEQAYELMSILNKFSLASS